tara:strand:- start:595 stop:840 length:246 start_codon:yes stop_codon:yes gene_type:complete
MQITKDRLKQIIKEEINLFTTESVVPEADIPMTSIADGLSEVEKEIKMKLADGSISQYEHDVAANVIKMIRQQKARKQTRF